MKRIIVVTLVFFLLISSYIYGQSQVIYLDTSQPIEVRVNDLISKLTLEEKVSQMMHRSPAIPRLNMPAYNWWNECLHGVARSGTATVFPQSIGLGATFDDDLIFRIGTAVSDEARAMYNASIKKGYYDHYAGLTFWTPNINIFRDPRWGRGQETYGEDPFLTSKLGVSYVKALQGNNPKYLKIAACAKHFAVHSGPEKLRHEFNAKVSDKDLYETYLPAFKALVDANVEAVMCAYNRTNDTPCCGNNLLLKQILRDKWNFKGHIVSDCWALSDIDTRHKVTKNKVESAALALKSGVNLNCGDTYDPYLIDAVKLGLVTEKEIDQSLSILLKTKFKLGMFDPPEKNPYNSIPVSVINSEENRQLAREAALKSVVLLKNSKNVLPLKKDIRLLYLTGPNATSLEVLLGNYYGVNNKMTTILEGFAGKIAPGSQLQYEQGCLLDRPNVNPIDWASSHAEDADAVVVVLGISGLLEGEEGESIASEYYGDRLDYNIPKNQIDYLKKLKVVNKPLIVIITGGSPMNLSEVHELADAILLVWYPGEEGGNAVADIVFGDVSPSGKLPVTFPKSFDQLPPYEDYSMEGRTYRYMKEEPMYPFGFGLSYTQFEYSNLKLSKEKLRKDQSLDAVVTVANTGNYKSDEVVQLYICNMNSEHKAPLIALKGFKRITLKPNEVTNIKFVITPEMLTYVDDKGKTCTASGKYKVFIGGSLPCKRSETLGIGKPQEKEFLVK